MLKVAAESNPKKTAGCIAHSVRSAAENKKENALPTLLATGAPSVNQAVKSLAIARTYLKDDDMDVACSPDFSNPQGSALSLPLQWSPLQNNQERQARYGADDFDRDGTERGGLSGIKKELRVAQSSEPSVVAGAIAKKARAKEPILLLAIGPVSVNQTVRALIFANRYLQEDKLVASFQPEFIHIADGDGEGGKRSTMRSGVRFLVVVENLETGMLRTADGHEHKALDQASESSFRANDDGEHRDSTSPEPQLLREQELDDKRRGQETSLSAMERYRHAEAASPIVDVDNPTHDDMDDNNFSSRAARLVRQVSYEGDDEPDHDDRWSSQDHNDLPL
jgi:stage V sporulation protein S